MRITWTEYETFCRCPRWYTWSYNTEFIRNSGTGGRRQKDTQYLLRGNVVQDAIDFWCRSGGWKDRVTELKQLMEKELPKIIETRLTEALKYSEPQTDRIRLEREAKPLIHKGVQTLSNLRQEMTLSSTVEFEVQKKGETQGPFETELIAIADLILPSPQGKIIIEGKSTSHPENTTPEQLRWQLEVFKATEDLLRGKHYYLFYFTGERWPVWFVSTDHVKWVAERDEKLSLMVKGESKPTPNPRDCRICPHQNHCPDRYVSKREEASPTEVFKNFQVTSMD